jgi:hypothetical protein
MTNLSIAGMHMEKVEICNSIVDMSIVSEMVGGNTASTTLVIGERKTVIIAKEPDIPSLDVQVSRMGTNIVMD